MATPALRLTGITKRFGTVLANDNVDLEVDAAEIHGVIGENGAGKSTLVSILYGFHTADAGEIEIHGETVSIRNSADAIAHGVGMVHQHFMLAPSFTVLENVMLGAEGAIMLKDGQAEARAELERLANDYGLEADPDAVVETLPVGLQQRVEILKVLRRGARILILDEPTGVLTPDETDRFFDIIRNLRAEGVTVILITHKLREIMEVTDRVTVMRGGRVVGARATADTTREELAELMVGTRPPAVASEARDVRGGLACSVENVSYRDARGCVALENVSLALRAGEILGLAGVSGNGQTELLDLLSGIEPLQTGAIQIGETRFTRENAANPARMRAVGVAHVPEDRRRRGLVLEFEARENAILGYANGPATGRGPLIDFGALQDACAQLMTRFDVRPANPRLRAAGFSGGNQQKLVIGREISAAPRVMLLGQPTRGVDIGGIAAIHAEILALRDQGCAILLVSVELDEIFALSDRIAVIHQGIVQGEMSRADATINEVGLMMAGARPGRSGSGAAA